MSQLLHCELYETGRGRGASRKVTTYALSGSSRCTDSDHLGQNYKTNDFDSLKNKRHELRRRHG